MTNTVHKMDSWQCNVSETAMGQLQRDAEHVSHWLSTWFQKQPHIAPRLYEAMAYSALNGGKRMRASLVYPARLHLCNIKLCLGMHGSGWCC